MVKLNYFKRINIPVPKERIYSRLGYREGITKVSCRQKKEIEQYIKAAAGLLRLEAVYARFVIVSLKPPKISLYPKITLTSYQLSNLLKDSQAAVLMAATAGRGITNAISRKIKNKNFTGAVIFDAVASEMVDASLDWIMGYLNKQLKKEKSQLTAKRFSCGYGDFILKNQRSIFNLLKLKRIGLSINKSYILNPEKSVTAVAGLKGF